jgi:putative ABC transport system permease protein
MLPHLRYALRGLGRRPGVLVAVVSTLGLGVGVNTALFSIVETVLLRPLPVPHAEHLVAIDPARSGAGRGTWALDDFRVMATDTSTLIGVAAGWTTTIQAELSDLSDLNVAFVSDNFFSLLGIHAAFGRTFTPLDRREAGTTPVVVLSAAFWRRAFGSSQTVLGRTIQLRGEPFRVIGVAPEAFHGVSLSAIPDLWAPISTIPLLNIDMLSVGNRVNPSVAVFNVFGRLRPGVTIEHASADLELSVQRMESMGRASRSMEPGLPPDRLMSMVPLTEAAGGTSRAGLIRLLRFVVVVVVLTLLLACVNVANVLLVRAQERERELAIRTALGASQMRLVRQSITEGALLAVAACITGIVAAYLALRLVARFTLPGRIALSRIDVHLDASAVIFSAALAAVTAFAFSMAPAIRAARTNALEALRHRSTSGPALHARAALLSAQVAISLALLAAAALFLRSVREGLRSDLGFDPRPLAAVSVSPKFSGRHAENIRPYYQVINDMRGVPGVIDVAASTQVPLGHAAVRPFGPGPFTRTASDSANTVMTGIGNIAGDYFRTMGVPLMVGRGFTDADDPNAERVVILNSSAARVLWPGQSPIGKQVHSRGLTYTVVGVARDTKYTSLSNVHMPVAFVPISQEDFFAPVSFVVRSERPTDALAVLRRVVHDDAPDLKTPDLAGFGPRLISDQIESILAPQRFGAVLLSAFAILGLLVSGVGIYGTVAYSVTCRTAEIGIRIALGARPQHVLSLVVAESVRAVGVGIVAGGIAIVFVARLLAHFLVVISPWDWVSLSSSLAIVFVAAIAAAVVPSRRAVRIDPAFAIRES